MNFKNYFLLGILLCGGLACSSDDSPVGPEVPVLQKAKFAISVKNDQVVQRTKAEVPADKVVNKLTVGIFGDGWSTVYTQAPTLSGDGQFNEIGPQEVYAGAVKVVVVANASEDIEEELKKATTMDEFIAIPMSLDEEYNIAKGLTMSSQIFDNIEIKPDVNNCFGFADAKDVSVVLAGGLTGVEIKGGGAVELIRNMASVSLKSITLSSTGNYTSKSFLLKEVFVANVKSLSQTASAANWGNIEASFEMKEEADYLKYWVGETFDGAMDIGSYKHGTQTEKEYLRKEESEAGCLLTGGSWNTLPSSLGHLFYVYENTKGETLDNNTENYTLLVVKGDYTYTSVGGGDVTDENRFYAVIVNNPADMKNENYNGIGKHDYIRRNCKYEIDLTILGPGSEVPYDPMISSNLSAAVKVEPWNVRNVHEEVE